MWNESLRGEEQNANSVESFAMLADIAVLLVSYMKAVAVSNIAANYSQSDWPVIARYETG
jgi:hypothetical protein